VKTTLKNFLRENKDIFYVLLVILLTMSCIGGIYFVGKFFCGVDFRNSCDGKALVAMSEQNTATTEDTGLKCRQCGKNLKHKGFFCSEGCRKHYANEYHNERYGKAVCRNCDKEFIKPTAYDYCCSPQCDYEYYEDLKIVSEAEEYRKTKEKVEEK